MMKTRFSTALLTAAILAAPAFTPAFAQAPPPATTVPAPQPGITAPPVAPGAPVAPLLQSDANFVTAQLEGNLAEIQAAQLALKVSTNQDVRNFAQKLITDHTYAQQMLMPIADMHHIAAPTTLNPQHSAMLARLAKLRGNAFDRAYVYDMVQSHAAEINALNHQLTHGLDQRINAWCQNTRPTIQQHYDMAKQLMASLPHA